jgi:hypothetical protein
MNGGDTEDQRCERYDFHHILANVKDEPRDERRAQTEKSGVIALALTTG